MKIQKQALVALLALTVLTSSCFGQKFSFGTCPNPLTSVITPAALVFANLVGNTVTTIWRETARGKSPHQHGWRCITYTINEVVANAKYNVLIGGRKKITNAPVRVTGTIDIGGTAAAAAVATTFLTFTLNYGTITKSLNYYIVGLDAANPTYLALYACQNVAFGKLEDVILLTRPTVTMANLNIALTLISALGFPSSSLLFTYQNDCLVNN